MIGSLARCNLVEPHLTVGPASAIVDTRHEKGQFHLRGTQTRRLTIGRDQIEHDPARIPFGAASAQDKTSTAVLFVGALWLQASIDRMSGIQPPHPRI